MKHGANRILKGNRTIGLLNDTMISIDDAIAAVSTIGGTIYDMKLNELDDKVVWRVKLVRDGERVKVYVDATSGNIIEAKIGIVTMEQ